MDLCHQKTNTTHSLHQNNAKTTFQRVRPHSFNAATRICSENRTNAVLSPPQVNDIFPANSTK